MSDYEKINLSVIIPIYNEEKHIEYSINVINNYVKMTNLNYEIILIDDGSKDNTYKLVEKLISEINEIKIIKFSRNFGKEYAICAGLENCCGEAAIVMDSDLQHPPNLILKMVELWKQGYDIVECVKTNRGKERIINKVGAKLFYGILKKFSGYDLNGASDFKLLDRKVIESWKTMTEKNTFFRGMSAWLGYNKIEIPFEVEERVNGQTHWSIISLINLAISAITSFSSIPLHLISLLGYAFFIVSVVLGINTIYFKVIGKAVSGFTTVILLLLIIGGLIMICLGIIGEYIARIYEESKGRPRYIIEKIDSIRNLNEKKLIKK